MYGHPTGEPVLLPLGNSTRSPGCRTRSDHEAGCPNLLTGGGTRCAGCPAPCSTTPPPVARSRCRPRPGRLVAQPAASKWDPGLPVARPRRPLTSSDPVPVARAGVADAFGRSAPGAVGVPPSLPGRSLHPSGPPASRSSGAAELVASRSVRSRFRLVSGPVWSLSSARKPLRGPLGFPFRSACALRT